MERRTSEGDLDSTNSPSHTNERGPINNNPSGASQGAYPNMVTSEVAGSMRAAEDDQQGAEEFSAQPDVVQSDTPGAYPSTSTRMLGESKAIREARNSARSSGELSVPTPTGSQSMVGSSHHSATSQGETKPKQGLRNSVNSSTGSGLSRPTPTQSSSLGGTQHSMHSLGERKSKRESRSTTGLEAPSQHSVGAHHSVHLMGESKTKREARTSLTQLPMRDADADTVDGQRHSNTMDGQESFVVDGSMFKRGLRNNSAPSSITTKDIQGSNGQFVPPTTETMAEGANGMATPVPAQATTPGAHPTPGAMAVEGLGAMLVAPTNPGQLELGISTDEGLAVANPVEEGPPLDLPLANDYDEEALEQKHRTDKQKYRMLLVLGLVIVGVIALVVGLLVRPEPDIVVQSAPTAAPSMAPTSFFDSVKTLLPEASRQMIDQSSDSAQARAFEWLMEDPKIGEYEEWRILQRFALVTLFFATNGPGWYNNTLWGNHSTHECEWTNFNTSTGIHAIRDPATFEVTGYEFLAPEAPCTPTGNFSDADPGIFRHLWIAGNGLEGTLPDEIWLLTSLQSLALHENQDLKVRISSEIGRMTNLEGFAFSFTDMEGTPLPSEIGQCTNLKFSFTSAANLGGSLPTELGNLENLKLLFFGENRDRNDGSPTMATTLPSELGRLTNLQRLNGVGSGVSGTLPTQLGLLHPLVWLILDQNKLSGNIPTELGGLPNLELLGLSTNQLTGRIPTELAELPFLFWLNLRQNVLTGSLPSELGQVVGMYEFTMDENHLTGTIPTQYGNLGQYGMLDFWLSNNDLSGPVPSELGQIPYLQYLWLQNNTLTGPLPSELGLTKGLKEFLVSDTDVTGIIPIDVCFLGSSNCSFFDPDPFFGGNKDCVLSFDCSDTLCGCDCPCQSNSSLG